MKLYYLIPQMALLKGSFIKASVKANRILILMSVT